MSAANSNSSTPVGSQTVAGFVAPAKPSEATSKPTPTSVTPSHKPSETEALAKTVNGDETLAGFRRANQGINTEAKPTKKAGENQIENLIEAQDRLVGTRVGSLAHPVRFSWRLSASQEIQPIASCLQSLVVKLRCRHTFPAIFFVLLGSFVILLSRQFGSGGSVIAVCVGTCGCIVVRNFVLLSGKSKTLESSQKLIEAIATIQSWQTYVPRTSVVDHQDVGFTSGIIGFGKNAQIVIPKAWLAFTREELATAIARRAVAINSGSYSRGLLLAFVWNVVGFAVCAFLVGSELT